MVTIGTVIDGKYEILKKIGQGGMSRVYLAMDNRLNKQWAVKEIDKQINDKNNEIAFQSLVAEANLMKKLDHPSLPRIVDIIDSEETIYIIMDYIEGEPLSTILDGYGAQAQDVVIMWAQQLCEVLDYLHTRTPVIIYRDMKPANVMLRPDGNIKLIDFGIAREYKDTNISDTVNLGTKGYAAPEQFGGQGQTDPRTDIYCLGVTLYHLVTGQNPCEPPYELYPIRHWNASLSGGLEKIIQKATQLNPEDRYQSCAELLYALDHYEEFDDVYRRRQKTKLQIFVTAVSLFALFLCIGIIGQFMNTAANNSNYDRLVAQAQKSTLAADAENLYSEAIEIKPSEITAYKGLITTYKADAAFTLEEEDQFKKIMNVHLSALRNSDQYASMMFEVGKLYWYYYDYGKTATSDNQITRMKSSIEWFEDAVSYGSEKEAFYIMAKTYAEIGKFNRDITLNINEASDKGQYSLYWNNMKTILNLIDQNPDEGEIVKLELYKMILYSMESYSRKFKVDGVEKSDIFTVFEAVKKSTESTSATSDKTQDIKERIVSRFDITKEAIENAYR